MGIENAEAARLGGGKSFGMQRQAVTPKPAGTNQQAAPAAPKPATAAPAPATPKRNWLGPIAGLAAGLGIAALLSQFGLGEGVANAVMIGLLVLAAVFVFRLLFRRPASASPTGNAMQYAGAGGMQPPQTPPSPVFAAGSEARNDAAASVAGFDSEEFLRVAKVNFVRLQVANDAGNLDDLRQFLAPELFAEISLQISERAGAPQQTDVVTLQAELLEVCREDARYIASVHFSGMIRERAGANAEPFAEVWHLAKPVDGSGGWVVAGIQQVG